MSTHNMGYTLYKLRINAVILKKRNKMNNDKPLIGKKIKEIRKKNNLTQEGFCEMIGIEPSSLSNVENGKSFPSMQTVLKIMEKFKVSAQDFFDFKYLMDEKELDTQIFELIKNMTNEKKQIIYRIIQQFDL